jgi:hypothetical protein
LGLGKVIRAFFPRKASLFLLSLRQRQTYIRWRRTHARRRHSARSESGTATRINEEARTNPDSQYADKFVGIANGQIVVVADTLDAVSRRLRQSEPDPSKCFIVEASRDYSIVEEIWELR